MVAFFSKYHIVYFLFSILIAFASSIVSFDMVLTIIPKIKKQAKVYWLLLASFTLGLGMWTTHFIGIKALRHTNVLAFHLPLLIASLVVVILTSFFGIFILIRKSNAYLTAGFTFAFGISALHYLGMYSYHSLSISIMDKWFITGVLFGTILSIYSCYLFTLECRKKSEYKNSVKPGSLLGVSVGVIHYVSMTSFTDDIHNTTDHIDLNDIVLFVIISVFLLIVIGLVSTYYQQKLLKQSERLKNQELYYKSLYELNPDAIVMMDPSGVIIKINEAAERIAGMKRDDALGTSYQKFIYESDLSFMNDQFTKALYGEVVESEVKMYNTNGQLIDIYVKNIPIEVKQQVVGVYGVFRDITEHKRNLTALQNAESRYRSIVEESFVGVFITQNEKIIFANAMMGKMFGYLVEELLELPFWAIVLEDDHEYLKKRISNRMIEGRNFEHYELRGKRKNGEVFNFKAHASVFMYNHEPAVMCSVIDVTDQVESLKKVEFMAYHDSLSNLPNQRKLRKDLTESIEKKTPFSLLYLDLNEFKKTNDRYGHLAGDAVLKEVAVRLSNVNQDTIAYHLGGDEFCVFIPSINDADIKRLATHFAGQIRLPIVYQGFPLHVFASMGVAKFPSDGTSIEALLRRSDLAMYASKKTGGDELVFYERKLLASIEEKVQLEKDLKDALEKEQFLLFYQPQFDLLSGKCCGAEALIRWNHPTRGLLAPNEFIHVLEETGLIIEVGEWVIFDVLKSIRKWKDADFNAPKISINISAQHFDKKSLYKLIYQANKGKHDCLKSLDIEITESAMINLETSTDILKSLKDLGIKISLDDFGTGYSSLSVLHQLPIDFIKIDRSFIKNFEQDSKIVIQMILNMAKKLNVKVVAEGIETKEQLDFLIAEGCDYGQGYYFSKPLPKEEFEKAFLHTINEC